MNQKGKVPGVRLRFNQKDQQFPEKLYDVANDGYLVRWNGCGTAIQVDDPDKFENEVMKCYPGFLQIPSFANFRRLFREYSFNRTLLDDGITLEFSHPYFSHGFREGLSEIRTRRKSFSKPTLDISSFQRDVNLLNDDDNQECRRYRTRRSRLTKTKQNKNDNSSQSQTYSNSSTFIINDGFQGDESNDSIRNKSDNNVNITEEKVTENVDLPKEPKKNTYSSVSSEIMRLFIKNEFTFEDFCAWAERNQSDFIINANKHDIYDAINRQNDYMNQSLAYNHFHTGSQITDNQTMEEPCGQCRCCRAHQHSFDTLLSSRGDVSCDLTNYGDVYMSYGDQNTAYTAI